MDRPISSHTFPISMTLDRRPSPALTEADAALVVVGTASELTLGTGGPLSEMQMGQPAASRRSQDFG
jgi:hypothetical protein